MLINNLFELEYFNQWLIEKKQLAESTRQAYKNMLTGFLTKNSDLESLETYNNYIIKYGIKKRGQAIYHALKLFVEYKIEDRNKRTEIIQNLIKPPMQSTRIFERKYLEETEILNIINNMLEHRHKMISLIQQLTGVRAGDLMRLKRHQITPELYEGKNVLKIVIHGKGNKRNVVYIHEETAQKLLIDFLIINYSEYALLDVKRIRKKMDDGFKFKRLIDANYKAYMRDLKQAMYKVGLNPEDFASHDYRRCYARRVWTKYKDLQVLQNMLNHANPATTMLYLQQSGLKNIDYHKELQR